MKSIRFFIATALMLALAYQNTQAQRYLTELVSSDIALVKCTTTWLGDGQVQVTWTVKNQGRNSVPLLDKEGQPLVSYSVEGTATGIKDGTSNIASSIWNLLTDARQLEALEKELAPGATATGSFTFEGKKEDLVSYRVTLDTERVCKDLNSQNNIYVGLVGK